MSWEAIGTIDGYHAHVYFTNPLERERAMEIREAIGQRFGKARLGRVHEGPIGPHPEPMDQVALPTESFAQLVPWLVLNRAALSVLVHPLLGEPLSEHGDQALWPGRPLGLRLEIFGARNEGDRAK